MKECGYSLTVEYIAEAINAREDDTSLVGFAFNTDALAARYESMGLVVERSPGGSVRSAECKICKTEMSTRTAPSGTRAVFCDPELHTAYYDAFNGGN